MASDGSPKPDETVDPALASWIPVALGSDFPIQNLPFAALRDASKGSHLCVAIGELTIDVHELGRAGCFDGVVPGARELVCAPLLGPLLAAGQPAWRAVRRRLSELLREGGDAAERDVVASALRPQSDVDLFFPVDVPDYVDFYSSLEHATNVGKIFRPGGEPLLPNWRYIPIGYHGRTSTLVTSGTSIVRPSGQLKRAKALPEFGPSRALDFELELGFVTGNGPQPPARIAVTEARDAIFGTVLLNDWSARDIQAWENQPLGPFLSKSFATSLSPWIVMLDALEPFRVAGPLQDPPPLEYLSSADREGFDIELEVDVETAWMRAHALPARRLTRSNFRAMYWSMAQQLAHVSSNGARVRAGDLFGSGTISGSDPDSFGSLIELTWAGAHRIEIGNGESRAYLEDGDEVVMRGWCAGTSGRARIGFGEVRGRVLPAIP